jgi:hypothetical protein
MEYAISNNTNCYYLPDTDTLLIGFPQTDLFNDMDIIKLISDSIVHETIHMLLDRDFNITISCLFDIVSDSFHEHMDLFRQLLKVIGAKSWKQSVAVNGLDYFISHYSKFMDKNVLKEYHIGGR